jgi:uncharacterized protein (DUF305 family)
MKQRTILVAGVGAGACVGFVLGVILPPAGRAHMHDTERGDTTSFYAEIATANARMHQAMSVAPVGDVDRDFANMMIPHHQGAIDMALVLLKHGRDERLKRLAQSIIVEQGQEITYMRTLLDSPAATAGAGHAAHQ